MVQIKGKKRTYIIVGSILALLIVVIGIVAIVNGSNSKKQDPYKQVETTNTQTDDTDTSDESTQTSPTKPDTSNTDKDSESTLDLATVSTVDIQPMELTVSYVKGTPGFEFFVMRTAAGTQYAEFSSPELAGTKCTNDKGVFASIIENPSDNETSTLSKTTTVDGTKYGLSLSDATCTSNAELLKQYQTSFSNAYSLLKKLS